MPASVTPAILAQWMAPFQALFTRPTWQNLLVLVAGLSENSTVVRSARKLSPAGDCMGSSTGFLPCARGIRPTSPRFTRPVLPSTSEPPRTESGYRQYSEDQVDRICFIKRGQELGFSLSEIKEMLSLRVDEDSDCGDVRRRADLRIAATEVDDRLALGRGRFRDPLQEVGEVLLRQPFQALGSRTHASIVRRPGAPVARRPAG
jgi:DNA-binding transcriptional MerR regulator